MAPIEAPPRHPRQKGERSRDRITAALRRRRTAGRGRPTVEELCSETRLSKTNVRHHLDWLEQAGLIALVEGKREISRIEIELLEDPPSVERGVDHGKD